MPITPFHFGPGALFKCAAPRQISWTVFALANMIIDLEPIALFFFTGDPAHPWLHTLLGAVAVATLVAIAGPGPCERFLTWWNFRLDCSRIGWLKVGTDITPWAAWTGAFLGTGSHILLDAVMHVDVKPFWPLVATNPLQGLLGIDLLHWACVAGGIIGIGSLAISRLLVRPAIETDASNTHLPGREKTF